MDGLGVPLGTRRPLDCHPGENTTLRRPRLMLGMAGILSGLPGLGLGPRSWRTSGLGGHTTGCLGLPIPKPVLAHVRRGVPATGPGAIEETLDVA
jgi:hypothetical protein